MRGKVTLRLRKFVPDGITPAYAGKSFLVIPLVSSAWDHPRVCGEKVQTSGPDTAKVGSPPRMRGKVKGRCRGLAGRGITPAYAGKRTARTLSSLAAWDHPRVCGEKCKYGRNHSISLGSPPRMRGKE